MDELINQLKITLGTTFSFYLKAQGFHWNVQGPNFPQYHTFFGSLYEDVYGSIDPMAEEIRALDSFAPGSISRMLELSTIKDQDKILSAKDMIDELARDNYIVITELNKTFALANDLNKQGLADFIAGRIDAHTKHAWMLKATGA